MAATRRGTFLSFGALSTLAGTAPAISEPDSARIYYELDSQEVMLSQDASAYVPLNASALVAGGWTRDGGPPAVVRLTTDTDAVSIGDPTPPADQKLYVIARPTTAAGSVVRADLQGEQDGSAAVRGVMDRVGPLGAGDAIACMMATPEADAGDVFPAFACAYRAGAPAGAVGTGTVLGFLCEGVRGGASYVATMLTIDQDVIVQSATLSAGDAFDASIISGTAFLNGDAGDILLTCGLPENTDAAAHDGGSIALAPSAGVGGGAHGSVLVTPATAAQVPFVVQGMAAQTGDRMQIQDAAAVVVLAVDAAGNLELRPVAAAAGSNSTRLELQAVNSVGTREWDIYNDGAVGADTYALTIEAHTTDVVLLMQWDTAAGNVAATYGVDDDSTWTHNGSIAIGSGAPAVASAMLEVESTTRGFLPPRMTTGERDAIAAPATGLVIYNTTTNVLNFFNGAVWGAV